LIILRYPDHYTSYKQRRAMTMSVHNVKPSKPTKTNQDDSSDRKVQFYNLIEKCRFKRNTIKKRSYHSISKENVERWTKHLPLDAYEKTQYIPEIVNVVSLCNLEAIGETQLPLNLYEIAKKCNGTFYAPQKFAAVQAGIDNPKSRILIFHTGRIVQTGTTSIMAARVAIMQTLKMLYKNTGMQFRATNFSIINIVGAVSLNTVFNCESFAYNHSDEVRFDPRNFVGLTWKPTKLGVPIIVEVYSTGRANIPGATREHILYNSFAKLIPELLRYSSASQKQEHEDHFEETLENDHSYDDLDNTLYMGQLGNLSTRI